MSVKELDSVGVDVGAAVVVITTEVNESGIEVWRIVVSEFIDYQMREK